MPSVDRIADGRQAFAHRQWRVAYEHLHAALAEGNLPPEDLERAAVAAYLTGHEVEANASWRRAHHERIDRGDLEAAARCGFWLSLAFLLAGESSHSAGWLARTQRLLQGHPECAACGLTRVVEGLHQLAGGDAGAARVLFRDAVDLGTRFAEPDLLALALLAEGQACIQLGEAAAGVRLLDEAMATVTGSDVSPIATGIVYCAVILTCQSISDLRRSCEWTLALDRWCGAQPELVAFRGACLLHRSEVLQLRGEWEAALAEAATARDWALARQRPAGRAWYRCAELHRLRGELDRADEMYREASLAGVEPQPGMSLLRLAQGELEAAVAAIRRVLDEADDRQGPRSGWSRTMVLAPYVEIMLAAGDVAHASAGAAELAAIAAKDGSLVVRAMSAEATGAVRLAEGDAAGALAVLRDAWAAWQELGAPYESARMRVLIGRACDRLGDQDTARSHFDGAAATFEELGAAPDRGRIATTPTPVRSGASLSAREREVLSLLAAGKTNREIGATLCISEHTVARHVSNILHKIGVASRTAAAAYAFAHDLARRSQS